MIFFKSKLVLFCLLFLQACSNSVNSGNSDVESELVVPRTFTVQGQASITNGAKLLARKQAFTNALTHIPSQSGGFYSSEVLLGSTKVVDEWVVDNIYHVQVLAILSEDNTCHSPYRKRLLVTGFPSVVSGQISGNETQDLYSGIPREMMNILMESGAFIGRNETHSILYSYPDMAPEIIDESGFQDPLVVQLAEEYDAQFVISGVIRDMEVESTEYVRGAGAFAQIKSLMRDFIARRGIAIDVYVHDGMTGDLLFQHRYIDRVIGDVWIPTGYSVGSERFKSTPTGNKISKIIQLASKDINDLFSCYPFSAKIHQVDNNNIYIAAGAQDRIKIGDSLVVYSKNPAGGMIDNQLVGVLNIKSVQASFSVGKMELTSDARKVKAGDVVKSW